MSTSYPTPGDDVIDSRDIVEAVHSADMPIREHAALAALLAELRFVAENYDTDAAEDGVTLVADEYFTEYARELVEDCGYFALNADRDRFGSATTINFNAWPYRCIDWQQVADELRQDYTSVSFDGITYWVR